MMQRNLLRRLPPTTKSRQSCNQRGRRGGDDHDEDDEQGGRTWQAFGGGKHGHETFRQARNYNFRDKCVVFARNLNFLNLTQ